MRPVRVTEGELGPKGLGEVQLIKKSSRRAGRYGKVDLIYFEPLMI
jgi:hypothetical protein